MWNVYYSLSRLFIDPRVLCLQERFQLRDDAHPLLVVLLKLGSDGRTGETLLEPPLKLLKVL